ncbi:MAG: hypothetical protein ACYC8S_00790 [Minisyncoccota bacterium]
MDTKGQQKDISENKDTARANGADNHDLSLRDGTREHALASVDQNSHAEVFLLIHRKTERLSTAVYLVTSFLSDNEPLKWRMREAGLVVLEGISELREGVRFERDHSITRSVRAIHDILSLAEIAVATGMMSEMNFRILKSEYRALLGEIQEKNSVHTSTHFELPKDFFSGFETPAHIRPLYAKGISQGQSKGQQEDVLYASQKNISERKNDRVHPSSSLPPVLSKGSHASPLPHRAKQTAQPPQGKAFRAPFDAVPTNAAKGIRRDTVLELFHATATLTVKDVAKKLPGFSEKTAQRELAVLVAEGVLKRTGERRWSIYSRLG